jgi:hypothetical protein
MHACTQCQSETVQLIVSPGRESAVEDPGFEGGGD